MKPPTSVRSVERSSRRRPTRNQHNLLRMKKNRMKNRPVVVGPKVLLVRSKVPRAGQAVHLGGLAALLVGLRGLPVDQAGHLEGAEHDGPRKA